LRAMVKCKTYRAKSKFKIYMNNFLKKKEFANHYRNRTKSGPPNYPIINITI